MAVVPLHLAYRGHTPYHPAVSDEKRIIKATVTPLPGMSCVHYRKGRCLRGENQNPGLHGEWRCLILTELESAYDDFIAQAENFQLDIELATRIWARRLGGLLQKEVPCQRFTPLDWQDNEEMENAESGRDALACAHAWAGLCLLALPPCLGICDKYEHNKR